MDDYDRYMQAMKANNVHLAILIEERYGLDGYPPNLVARVLYMVCKEGDSIDEALDDVSSAEQLP